jgi:hypothetical protein
MLRAITLGLAIVLALSGCKSEDAASGPADAGDPCAILFGNPNDQTGLEAGQCRPSCACGGDAFTPPTYGADFVHALVDDYRLEVPYSPLTSDPYATPPPAEDPNGTVCAVLLKGTAGDKPRPYTLVTYPSADAARVAGASVTHFGHCGVCSSLVNLAVYMKENDLTAPVRSCGLETATDGGTAFDADVACLQKLGFDLPCAQAWAYDTLNTRKLCLAICLANLDQPYNLEDGTLNPCIQCDEDKSGPVFKAVAGRTRRNSGLPNAICRPCSEVQPLVHAY